MSQKQQEDSSHNRLTVRCSFCGCGNHECRVMVDGGAAAICNECILLANEAVAQYYGDVEYMSWAKHMQANCKAHGSA